MVQAKTEEILVDLPTRKIPYELVANHMITSSFSFIQWWLNNDMSHTPEQMGDYAAQLIMLPIRRLLVGENG